MSAIFAEILRFGQGPYPTITLRVTGDEFYAVYETLDGFTVVDDQDRSRFCYALLINGALVSSGVPAEGPPPPALPRHLRETVGIRSQRFDLRRQRLGVQREAAAPGAALTLGPSQGLLPGRRLSNGSVRGLTILVEFQDVRTAVTRDDVDALLNAPNYTRNGNFCSAREYFRIVSSGQLDYSNDVVGPFRLRHDQSYYVTHLLIQEALDLAVASGVDLTRYDSRGEGILDALNVLYAGQTQYVRELWPHNSTIDLRYGDISTNLYLLTSAGRSADDLSIGTFCHENGHLLCRFPDMYDYGDVAREGDGVKSAGIGAYCLMGSGNHLNSGRTPSPVCAYLRDLAGWCREISLNSDGNFDAAHGAYDTVLKYRTTSPNEYFIVENRSKIGLDAFLPSSGLAVYHCDVLGSNEFQQGTTDKHYQCALLQADGHTDLERNVNQGDGTDLFSGVTGVAVSNLSTPSSRAWSGADSGLLLSAIDLPGPNMAFRVGEAAETGSLHFENATAIAIPDNDAAGINSRLRIGAAGAIARVVASVDVTHPYIGDLVITLTSPRGTRIDLHDRAGGGTDNLLASYDSRSLASLRAIVGEPAEGEWVLGIRDLAGRDEGKLNKFALDLTMDGKLPIVQGSAAPNLPIPDDTASGVSSVIALNTAGSVDKIKIGVDITHTYIGDLRIELVSPTGRRVVLHGQVGGGTDNLVGTYDSAQPLSPLSALVGQPITGHWTLRIADLAKADVGKLNRWNLEIVPA